MWLVIQFKQIKRALMLFFALLLILLALAAVYINIRFPLKYIDLIQENSKLYGLDPALVCAMIHAESSFDRNALSKKGASGLMQITEATGNWIADEMGLKNYRYDRIFEPELNIRIGCYYISRLIRQYNGDLTLALSAYNAGSGNIAKWLDNPEYSANGKGLTYIPFPETRNYIKKIDRNIKIYDYILKLRKY